MNTIYIITIILVMTISIIGTIINNKGKEKKENKPSKIFLYIIIIVLIAISGMRDLSYNKGSDEDLYRNYYDRIMIMKSDARGENREYGYWLINYILTLFIKDNQAIIILCAVITNFLIVKNLYKYSNYFNFSLFLYISLGTYFETFNVMRQFLAAAILFQGINYIIEKKKIKYIICVAIATSIHFSAIVMLPIYWIVQIKNKKKLYYSIIIFAVIFSITFFIIIGVLGSNIVKFEGYYNAFYNGSYGVNIFRILVISLPVILIGLQYNKIIKGKEELEIIYFHSFLCMIFMICAYQYVIIARLCIYFYVYYIIMVPELIYLIKEQKSRIFALVLIYCLYFIFGYINCGKQEYKNFKNDSIKSISIFE